MPYPIIATSLRGIFVDTAPWAAAHSRWFGKIAERLDDDSIMQWAYRDDYFLGVDEAMEKLYPDLSDDGRTLKARELYFDCVIEELQEHPEARKDEMVDYFKSLKNDYRIALVTTNTEEALDRILSETGISGLFDIRITSREAEKDDKSAVFDRLIQRYGVPRLFVGGNRASAFEYCMRRRIPSIYANLSDEEPIVGVRNIKSLDELKDAVNEILGSETIER